MLILYYIYIYYILIGLNVYKVNKRIMLPIYISPIILPIKIYLYKHHL
jgi:hypothetical protein